MKGSMKMVVDMEPLKKLQKRSPKIFQKAMEKGAIQFLTWANDGSPRESRRPPIRWGVLRGSASAFVGGKLVAVSPVGSDGEPLTTYQDVDTTISWIWNAPYAAKMHEHTGNWGPYTTQDSNAGNKWLEKHLQADKEALLKMIEVEFWKAAKGF